MPEALLLAEIMLHPRVLTSLSAARTLARLIFSDGKPIIVFASSEDTGKPLHPSLLLIRDSLRRRLNSVAASLSMRDGCAANQCPNWTYSGLLGILVGGELLTGIGACLFLRVHFGWAAVISLLASLVALVISTPAHMRSVGKKPLHTCHQIATGSGGRFLEFVLPGPLVLTRLLLVVPVWPMIVVYAEGLSFWPFSMTQRGENSRPPLDNAMWVWPPDWLRVDIPEFGASDNNSPLSFFYWAVLPHLVWTVLSATWLVMLGLTRLVCWYYGYAEDWSAHPWGVYFASQESPFHVWALHVQRILGLGFTIFMTMEFRRLALGLVILSVLLFRALGRTGCVEHEWAFVFAHFAWWIIMLIGHAARRWNVFKPWTVQEDSETTQRC